MAQSWLWGGQVSVKKDASAECHKKDLMSKFIMNKEYLADIKEERKRTKKMDRKKEQFQIMFVKKILKVTLTLVRMI